MTWALDLDGVVWRASAAVPGSPEAVGSLRDAGERVVFVTNNSARTSDEYAQALRGHGIAASPEDVVHGGHAVASLVRPGAKVLGVCGPGVVEALDAVGAEVDIVDGADRPARQRGYDAVVVGIRAGITAAHLSLAVRAVLEGATLLGPSADPLHPVADGFDIGGGALLAAVAYATGVEALVGGKPHPPMAAVVRQRFGSVDVVVGDQARSDGRLAEQLGARFLLVRSGVGSRGEDPAVLVAARYDDLARAVATELGPEGDRS